MIFGVRKWAVTVGLATIAAGFLGAMIGGWKSSPPAPPGPPPCTDAVAILGSDGYKLINCNAGERMEIERQGTVLLARCFCPTVRR